MARDLSGTYTAPSNSINPAVEGTVIDEGDFNTTLQDIEDALTDSLSVSGKGKITAYVDFDEIAAPSSPAANVMRLYASDNGSGTTVIRVKDSAGTVTTLGAGGGGGGGISNVVEDTTPSLGGPLDGDGFDIIDIGVLTMREQAAADADVAGLGQWWVQTATPNLPMFTNDAGNDFQLATLTGTETLTNKTLTAPTITDGVATGSLAIPVATGPTTNAAGEIAINSDGVNADWTEAVIQYTGDGTNVMYAIAVHADRIPVAGDDSYVLKYDATNNRFDLAADAGAGGGISNVVEDTTPQLGGNLDLNGFVITGLVIGTNVQAYDADLASWAGVTRAANFDTFVATPSSANLISLLTDETGTGSAVFATSPTLVTPVLGTPSSGTLTSCTGLPISTGVAGLGANVATFLGTPSLANLNAAVTGGPVQAAGVQEWFIPASSFVPRTTNPCAALATLETTTNRVNIDHLAFDATTQEFAQCLIPRMPKSWNESTITAIPIWSHPSTTTNFGVVWGVSGVALGDDDAADTAFGTAQTSTDTGGTTDDIYHGPATSAVTIGGTPVEGDTVILQVSRNPTDGSDTMAVDARFHGLLIRITTNAANDA